MRSLFLTAALLVMALPAASLRAAHVKDPKASLVDVRERHNELRHTKEPRVIQAIGSLHSCLALPAVQPPKSPMMIPPHYLGGPNGSVNPEEQKATRVYNDFENRITAGMNQWLVTGNSSEAKCAQQQMDSWAQAEALLNYDSKKDRQAWFQVEWTASSAAITESVLVNEKSLDKAMVARDIAWLGKVAHHAVALDTDTAEPNNHHYWRGLMAVATGVVASDDELFTWGVNAYKRAVDAIDQRGAFPQEMKRKERSLHYQSFALQPLVPLACFAERQGVHLYAYTSTEGRDLADAIEFLSDALQQPALIRNYTPEEQVEYNGGDTYAFAEYYNRFKTMLIPPAFRERLNQPVCSSRIGGNTTVMAGISSDEKKKR